MRKENEGSRWKRAFNKILTTKGWFFGGNFKKRGDEK